MIRMPASGSGIVWGVSVLYLVGIEPAVAQEPSARFSVAVYNIHAGKDADGEDNLSRVTQFIRDHELDLILLQEVDRGTTRSGGIDQITLLADSLDYHWAFGETLAFQGGQYGIAVLSRWPLHADTLLRLPVDPPQERAGGAYEPRGALYVVLNTPVGRLHVFNTHLDPSPNDHHRIQEVETLVQSATDPSASNGYVLIGGDFNSEPETRTISRMTEIGFFDSFDLCGSGPGGTYPTTDPVKRIDYLFTSRNISCTEALVVDYRASDHRPLVVSIELGGNDE